MLAYRIVSYWQL